MSRPARVLNRSALALLTFVVASLAFAQATGHCDRYLPVSRDNPFGYRLRGDRCEGVYVQQVAATPLIVASFGQLNLPERLTAAARLQVEWSPQPGEVRLRASSLKPRTYYRMDRHQPARARSYSWPTDVVSALKLNRGEIGIVALTKRGARDVYVPVRIGKPVAGRERMYELILVPGHELSEVYVGLSRVGADGKQTQVSPPKALRYGLYAAGRSVRVPVGPIVQSGTYLIEIGATLRDGGAVSREIWFEESAR